MKVLKKMSVRDLNGFKNGDLKKMAAGAPGEVYVCRIYGSARAVKTGTSTYGEFLEFTGSFQAVDVKGVECVSAKCFLPSPADDMLAGALAGEGVNAVDFAYDLFVVEDEKTEVGFQYRVHSLLEHKPSEPLKALAASLPPLRVATTPALTAPETPAETQAETVTKGKATK